MDITLLANFFKVSKSTKFQFHASIFNMLVAKCPIPFTPKLQFQIILSTMSCCKEEGNLRNRSLQEIKNVIKQIMRGRIVNGGTVWVSDGQNTNGRPKLQLKSAPP